MKKTESHNYLLTPTQLGEIKKFMPRGSVTQLATKWGVTPTYISQILSQKRSHEGILFDALDIALAEKQRQENSRRKIEQGIKQLSS